MAGEIELTVIIKKDEITVNNTCLTYFRGKGNHRYQMESNRLMVQLPS